MKKNIKQKINYEKNYYNLKINFNDPSSIEIINHIYSGKYSDVFEGIDIKKKKIVIIKCFKKTHIRKIKKEIFIIETLKNYDNIIGINKVIKDPYSNIISVIFDKFFYNPKVELKYLLNKETFRIYFKELCLAVKNCHDNEILHRDIKPENFLFDFSKLKGKLIDFGTAIFFKKNNILKNLVGSKFYIAPEKWVGLNNYNESSDIWSLGCILAEFIGDIQILFYKKDKLDQLKLMLEIIGYEKFNQLISNLTNENKNLYKDITEKKYPQGKWFKPSHLYSKEAFNLLVRILSFNPKNRPSINEILSNNFFKAKNISSKV